MRTKQRGFTLVELMVAVAIIGILLVIGVLNYNSSLRKAADGLTKGNLGAIRSALAIYFGDNEGAYPTDNLVSVTNNARYLLAIPITRIVPYHTDTTLVTAETTASETGGWSYNNSESDLKYGTVLVGCYHQDTRNEVWSTF